MKIADFPAAVAKSLKQLTLLDLSQSSFMGIPASISLITTLQILNLANNNDIHLVHNDVNILAALPHLRSIELQKEEGNSGWSNNDMSVARELLKRLPRLEVWFLHTDR